MDWHLIFSYLRIPFNRSTRKQPLSEPLKTNSTFSKNFLPFLLLIAGLISGVIAQQVNQSIIKNAFFEDHVPTQRSVQELLLAKSYKSIKELEKDGEIEEPKMPLKKNTFYQADEHNWILYTSQQESNYFCYECNHFPRMWNQMGSGWLGLEELISNLDQKVFEKPKPKSKKVRIPKKDAKEIVF